MSCSSSSEIDGAFPESRGALSESGGSNPKAEGSKSGNVTSLVETHLEDPLEKRPLEEESYEERGLPSSLSHTLFPGHKSNESKNPVGSSSVDTPGCAPRIHWEKLDDVHPFAQPIFSTPAVSRSSSTASPRSASSAHPSPCSSASSSALPLSVTPPRLQVDRGLEDRFYKNLDRKAALSEQAGTEFERRMNDCLIHFMNKTPLEELLRLHAHRKESELHQDTTKALNPVFKICAYQQGASGRALFEEFTIQTLTQAFCSSMDAKYFAVGNYCVPSFTVCLRDRLQPHWDALEAAAEARKKQAQEEELRKRSEQFVSPDKPREERTDLSAAEKEKVLRNALQVINTIGAFNAKGELHHNVVLYNGQGLKGARALFHANPDLTVAHVLLVMSQCIELNRDDGPGGTDPLWHARRGNDLAMLVLNFGEICNALNCVDDLPLIVPVDREQLGYRPRAAHLIEA
jgi:hypothetical protein